MHSSAADTPCASLQSHVGLPNSFTSKVRHVRRFSPHEGHNDNFASSVRHARRFRPHEGSQADYAMCVTARLIGLRRLVDGET